MHRPSPSTLLCVALGASAALGFAPLDLWPLSVGALAGWLALVHDAASMRQALWRGWLFGVGHFSVNNGWIRHAFDFQDAMPPVLGYGAVVGLALYLAVYPMLAAGLMWRVRRDRPDTAFVLAAAAAWIVTEWLRAKMFTGYAWNPLGVAWLPAAGIPGAARFVGSYAMSGLMVLSGGALLLAARRDWRFPAGVAALLIGLALFGRPALPPSSSNTLVRIVQPGIGQGERGEEDGERMLQALSEQSGVAGLTPRLLVWPEGVVRPLVEDGYPLAYYVYQGATGRAVRRRIASVLGPRDRLLFGGTALRFDRRGEPTTASNSVFALDWRGRLTGRYDKAHLVPYGEYLPMRWLLEPIGLSRLVPGDIDYADGPGPRALDLPGFGQVGLQICYEIIFSGEVADEAHRPRLLFNPSNEAWYGNWGPPQFLAQARMRAIEEGLPIIRATPTGISAAIGANGAILAQVPQHIAGAVELPLPAPAPPTPFARFGNLIPALIVALLVAAAIALRRRSR